MNYSRHNEVYFSVPLRSAVSRLVLWNVNLDKFYMLFSFIDCRPFRLWVLWDLLKFFAVQQICEMESQQHAAMTICRR